jgi:hypothetical protein
LSIGRKEHKTPPTKRGLLGSQLREFKMQKLFLVPACVLAIGLFVGNKLHADVVILNSDQGDYRFNATNTYYITNVVTISGTATFEGNTVIKYGPDAVLSVYTVDCETASNAPAYFTARDDDTLGVVLPDSLHVPPLQGYYSTDWSSSPLDTALVVNGDSNGNTFLQHIKITYANYGIFDNNLENQTTLTIDDANIRDCGTSIYWAGSDSGSTDVMVSNSRISHSLINGDIYSASFNNVVFNDVTIDDGGVGVYSGVTVSFTNSLLANTGYIWWDVDVEGTSNQLFNSDLFGDNYQILDLHAPSAFAQTVLTTPNNSVAITLDADSPDDKPLKYIVLSSPAHGTLSGTPPNLTYTPACNYDGTDSFTFTVDDGILDSTNATVSLLVDEPAQFAIEATNNYVGTSYPHLQLNVFGGFPSYLVVLVDTNPAQANGVWTSYTSSNLVVNLGTNEGWHDVWIGLEGFLSSPMALWQHKRMKLDLQPPVLVITSPTNGTVDIPIVQIVGYSPEAMASICYDFSNAVETATNRQVLVLDQFYDTNTLEFTTNTFQAFDVSLTNGLNIFTLHAADLAGNVATLVTNFTLDYSNKPPLVMQFIWPQDGMKVCGTNFICNGSVNDPTASIVAQTVDVGGNTNMFNGAVGRDGIFYIDNLPLGSGTNIFTLIATDKVGQTASTILTVIQGDAGLVVDPIPHNQTTVTGKINSNTFTVWVNGVKATMSSTVNGNGVYTWEADAVPIPPNSSLVQVSAIPNSDHGGYGSWGQ